MLLFVLHLPSHGTRQWIDGAIAEHLIDFTSFKWTDDLIGEIKFAIVLEKTDKQIAYTILAYSHVCRFTEVAHIFYLTKKKVLIYLSSKFSNLINKCKLKSFEESRKKLHYIACKNEEHHEFWNLKFNLVLTNWKKQLNN